jgi:hypothetical protein
MTVVIPAATIPAAPISTTIMPVAAAPGSTAVLAVATIRPAIAIVPIIPGVIGIRPIRPAPLIEEPGLIPARGCVIIGIAIAFIIKGR